MVKDKGTRRRAVRTPPDCGCSIPHGHPLDIIIGTICQWRLVSPEWGFRGISIMQVITLGNLGGWLSEPVHAHRYLSLLIG